MRLINRPGSIVGTTVYFGRERRRVISIEGLYLILAFPDGSIGDGYYQWYSRTIDGPRLTREDIEQ